MQQKLQQIAAALALELEGLREYKSTSAGMWAGSKIAEVFEFLAQIGLRSDHHLADFGSGDGRVVLTAALFCRATGLEIDPQLCGIGRRCADRLGLARARFLRQDYRQADLSQYDFLYLYPDKPLTWLANILPKGWPGQLLIYGHYFKPPYMRLLSTIRAGDTICTVWGP